MPTSLSFQNGTTIHWSRGDDGGGSTQYVDFLNSIPSDAKYKRCLEWCAGLSAISFSLLDAGIVEEVVLMDKHKPALLRAQLNAKNNGFNNVKYYHCDKISDLPDYEKFDLVVANPPHCLSDMGIKQSIENNKMSAEDIETCTRLLVDQDWKIHKEFFTNIGKYLNHRAELYISENELHGDLVQYIKDAGLILVKVHKADILSNAASNSSSVIMHIRHEK